MHFKHTTLQDIQMAQGEEPVPQVQPGPEVHAGMQNLQQSLRAWKVSAFQKLGVKLCLTLAVHDNCCPAVSALAFAVLLSAAREFSLQEDHWTHLFMFTNWCSIASCENFLLVASKWINSTAGLCSFCSNTTYQEYQPEVPGLTLQQPEDLIFCGVPWAVQSLLQQSPRHLSTPTLM